MFIARINPNIIIAEAPELIGVGRQQKNDTKTVQQDEPRGLGYQSGHPRAGHGGISLGQDVYDVIATGHPRQRIPPAAYSKPEILAQCSRRK